MVVGTGYWCGQLHLMINSAQPPTTSNSINSNPQPSKKCQMKAYDKAPTLFKDTIVNTNGVLRMAFSAREGKSNEYHGQFAAWSEVRISLNESDITCVCCMYDE